MPLEKPCHRNIKEFTQVVQVGNVEAFHVSGTPFCNGGRGDIVGFRIVNLGSWLFTEEQVDVGVHNG
jgi:hypothetical protein